MRIERRETRPMVLVATAPIIAVLTAFVLAGLLIAAAGAPVLESFRQIAIGAFGNKLSITETLTRATPLMLTGLAAAVAFRSKLWNIGAEGQFYMGALAVVTCGTQLQLPAPILIPLLLVIGAIAGMIFLLIPLGLRLRFGVDEVVTTLLLNFVAVLIVSMMIEGPMKDPSPLAGRNLSPYRMPQCYPKSWRVCGCISVSSSPSPWLSSSPMCKSAPSSGLKPRLRASTARRALCRRSAWQDAGESRLHFRWSCRPCWRDTGHGRKGLRHD